MTVGLYMDVHVPRAITQALRQRGVDVLTAQDDGTTRLSDPALLDRATTLSRVLFSQDRDVLSEATRRQRAGLTFAGVIFARQLDTTIGQRSRSAGCGLPRGQEAAGAWRRACVADLALLTQAGEREDFIGQVFFLPL